jgi:integrase
MATRVEQDRHYFCSPGACVAPAPRRLARGQKPGACVPRATWWLRTRNAAGKRVSVAFKNELEALAAAQKVEAALVLGVSYTPRAAAVQVPTFSAVADEALTLYQSTMSPRGSTLANHRGFLEGHLRPYFGSKPITTITTLEVQRFIAATRNALSDSTIKASLPTLRMVLDHGVKLGLLATNPMRSGERLWRPVAPEPVEAFTSSELRSILRVAREIDLHVAVLIQVMAQGGLRPGEAMGLRRQDVGADGVVHVQGSQGRFGRGPTKNAHSVRKVSVLHPVTEDRAVWRPQDAGAHTRRALDGLSLVVALAPDAESRLWPTSASQFDRDWRRILRAAGVPYRKPHALRHSFASIMLSRGANPLYVQKQGGWRSATVLFKTYAHYMPEDAAPASTSASTPPTPRLLDAAELTLLRAPSGSPAASCANSISRRDPRGKE